MSTAKNRTNEKTGAVNFQVPAFVTNGIESGRSRLAGLEEQAQDLFKDLYSRGNRELEQIRERLPVSALREKLPVDELVDRARSVESETRTRAEALVEDMEGRVHRLQDTILSMIGVASREQVAGLARDLDRLSRRLDRLSRQAKKASSAQAPKKAGTRKSTARKKSSSGMKAGS
ncbi:MAG: hypothetical protein ACOC0J_00525 [Myxococcota bacterium]